MSTLSHREPEYCGCDVELATPYERRIGKCYECERLDERMHCAGCGEWVGVAYCDGSPTFCSDECEAHFYDWDLA